MAVHLISTGLSGDIRNTTQPAFEVTGSETDVGNHTMFATDNGFSVTERYDQGADFNTANGLFTAPVTGRYYFGFGVRMDSLPNFTYIHIGLTTSNRTRATIYISQSTNRTYESGSFSTITDMDVNDTAKIVVFASSGGSTTDIDPESTFSGCLIC